MTYWERQRKLIIDTYNDVVSGQVEDPLTFVNSAINKINKNGKKTNICEMALLYSLKSDLSFEAGLFDDAYKFAMDGYKLDSERKEILQSLITVHIPCDKDDINLSNNPYQDDEIAHKYLNKLQDIHSNDPYVLYICYQCYSKLGLYDDALKAVKASFAKLNKIQSTKNNDDELDINFIKEIKKSITKTYIDRYEQCSNNEHELIIKYLIELIEWKYNDLKAENLQTCVEEIWERIEYILIKHLNDPIKNKWNEIHKLLNFIPCSIPLSLKLINLIYETFSIYKKYQFGIELFTRLITEYQCFNDNHVPLSLHCKFEHYDSLYLNRGKLYKWVNKINEMNDDIEESNTRIIMKNENANQVTQENLLKYTLNKIDEKPLIETVIQIKKRRASRLSNITISPMPKQYRDLHLTPKTPFTPITPKIDYDEKKDESLIMDHDFNDNNFNDNNDINDESQKCYKLKKDLVKQELANAKLSAEIQRLRQQIVRLTDNLNLHITANLNHETKQEKCDVNTNIENKTTFVYSYYFISFLLLLFAVFLYFVFNNNKQEFYDFIFSFFI